MLLFLSLLNTIWYSWCFQWKQKQLLFLGHSNWYKLITFHSHLKFITWNVNRHLLRGKNNWPNFGKFATNFDHVMAIQVSHLLTIHTSTILIFSGNSKQWQLSDLYMDTSINVCSGHGWKQWHITIWQFGLWWKLI